MQYSELVTKINLFWSQRGMILTELQNLTYFVYRSHDSKWSQSLTFFGGRHDFGIVTKLYLLGGRISRKAEFRISYKK